MNFYDVIIIGGGPAGLNAAVVLGRCRRKVILFDNGNPRNIRSHHMHNFLTRDAIAPADFLKLAHEELKKYNVKFEANEVIKVDTGKNQFKVTDKHNRIFTSGKLLIATGLTDKLPEIDGIENFYGTSVFHCPYCDGWEVQDKQVGLYSKNINGTGMALSLKTWSRNITLFTDGKKYLRRRDKNNLAENNVLIITTAVARLEGNNGILENIVVSTGENYACDALFFNHGFQQNCSLVKEIGCKFTANGLVLTDTHQLTDVPGLYVAGDANRDVQFVVVAAAEGTKAAVAINKELQKEQNGS